MVSLRDFVRMLFHSCGQERPSWQEKLAEVWRVIEKGMGVEKVFTTSHEPEFEETFYRTFLTRRGYAPDPRSGAVKQLPQNEQE